MKCFPRNVDRDIEEREKDEEWKWQNKEEEAGKVNESPCRTQNILFCSHGDESHWINVQCCFWLLTLLSCCRMMFALKRVKSRPVKISFGEMPLNLQTFIYTFTVYLQNVWSAEPKRLRVAWREPLAQQHSDKPPYGLGFGYSAQAWQSIPLTAAQYPPLVLSGHFWLTNITTPFTLINKGNRPYYIISRIASEILKNINSTLSDLFCNSTVWLNCGRFFVYCGTILLSEHKDLFIPLF